MNSTLLNQTIAAAGTAGEIIREHWRQPRAVRHKGRIDLVTKTDAAVEIHLKEWALWVYYVNKLWLKEGKNLPSDSESLSLDGIVQKTGI